MTMKQRCASTVAVIFTAVALLTVTGLGKVAVGFSGELYWHKTDPIFLLPKIQILPFLGLFEIVIAAFLIGLREMTQRLRIIYLVMTAFLAYRAVSYYILGNNSCDCFRHHRSIALFRARFFHSPDTCVNVYRLRIFTFHQT